MVNLDSSFVQTWQGPHPQCYIPSPKANGLLVPEKKIVKGVFTIYGRGGHLSQSYDHNNLFKFWLTYQKELSYEIWFQMAKWFLRKQCFNMLMGDSKTSDLG